MLGAAKTLVTSVGGFGQASCPLPRHLTASWEPSTWDVWFPSCPVRKGPSYQKGLRDLYCRSQYDRPKPQCFVIISSVKRAITLLVLGQESFALGLRNYSSLALLELESKPTKMNANPIPTSTLLSGVGHYWSSHIQQGQQTLDSFQPSD